MVVSENSLCSEKVSGTPCSTVSVTIYLTSQPHAKKWLVHEGERWLHDDFLLQQNRTKSPNSRLLMSKLISATWNLSMLHVAPIKDFLIKMVLNWGDSTMAGEIWWTKPVGRNFCFIYHVVVSIALLSCLCLCVHVYVIFW